MFSVIYTPTEGEAIADYSRLFRRPEGCFLNIGDIDRVEDDLNQWGEPEDIDVIVVSDGEQILGIGDQGVGAILISVAKLVIYTLCAGIHPSRTLPVVLDCGTDVGSKSLHKMNIAKPKSERGTTQRRPLPRPTKETSSGRRV
jgi:malate dehydrogenase (oxaloacetate-decarboxylating)